MKFDIDIAIVAGFLAVTLIVGLGHGQKIRNIKDYALGGRNFSTGALVATIVATYASGSLFFSTLSKIYSSGFYALFAVFGIAISFFITSYLIVPRMGEFLGKTSIAEAMGDLYGQKVRIITAISAAVGSAGLIAVQFKVFGNIFSYFLSMSPFVAIVVAGVITTIYSAFGGIRAVTFTDVLQFFAFGVIVPLVGFIVWNKFYHDGHSLTVAFSNPKFNLPILFDTKNTGFWEFVALFVYFSIPTMSAPKFQRISMGVNVQQVGKAFIISAIIIIAIQFAIAWISFLIHSINADIRSDFILPYIIDTFSFPGLKAFIIVAIIAFSMSTADSRINASAILFTHDFYVLLSKGKNDELFLVKIFGCLLGVGTIILASIETDLMNIIILANSYYHPLIVPPFFLTVFGFRSTEKPILLGMISGLAVTIIWKIIPMEWSGTAPKVAGLLLAMLCNFITLIASHYFLKQPGGWIKKNIKGDFGQRGFFRKRNNCTLIIENFYKKVIPEVEATYTTLGIYFIICTLTTMYSTQIELLGKNAQVMKIIYPMMLLTGTIMAMYQIWPLRIPTTIRRTIIKIWYPLSIFYMLIFFGCFFVLVSKFAPLQMSLLIVNLIVASLLLGWFIAIPSIVVGLFSSIYFYQYLFGKNIFVIEFASPEFILTYIILFVGTAVIAFLKPKQQHLEATESKAQHLETEVVHLDHKVTNLSSQLAHYQGKLSDHEKEIERLGATAQRILNNVNHELRLPVGNVKNFSEMLYEGLEKYSPEQLKELSDEVYKNSERLSSMILNMLDLANLDVKKVNLEKSKVNLSELVLNRIKICRNVYLQDKPLDFKLTIEPEIFIAVDPDYIRQLIDNLVINAINFSKEGTIEICLEAKKGYVIFTITDEGIGIPEHELYSIFEPFKMGSNTESKAEGRGVGLALCKSVAEAHDGSITAQNNAVSGVGAIFRVVIPK